MRIGLNATCFNDRPSGAKQRLIGLYIPAIRALPDTEFVVYSASDVDIQSWFDSLDNVSIRRTPIKSVGRWGRFVNGLTYWQSTLSKDRLDLLEGFHLPVVGNPVGQTLLTIHDVRGLHRHSQYSQRQVYKAALSRSLRRADTIITVSDAMKQEIHRSFPDASIKRIYNGIDVNMFNSIEDEDASQYVRETGLPEDFLFAIGHYEVRKNYSRLIDALKLLNERGFSIPLVIAGNDSGQYMKLQHKVEKAGLESQFTLLRNISDHEVKLLYRASRLFIFPSLYEGFGIPLIEAMAAGKPFLSSDISVFRELSQDNGYYFPVDDVEAMAESIITLSGSSDEQQRLISYGQVRVSDFSYEKLSQELISLYREQGSEHR